MAKFFIHHNTSYQYSELVRESAFRIRLYPIKSDEVQVITHQLKIDFNPAIATYEDFNENTVGTFSIVQPHQSLNIVSNLEVVTSEKPLPENDVDRSVQREKLKVLKSQIGFYDYFKTTSFNGDADLDKALISANAKSRPILDVIISLCDYVHKELSYEKGATHVHTLLDEIWNLKAGVCQDFAHILIQLLRKAGIPARYVSGYICPNQDGLIGEGATHAWVEAYIPDYGWLGIDPTNNCVVKDKHVRIATGRDYYDCSPVNGTYRGQASSDLSVKVTVEYEDDKGGFPEKADEEPNEPGKNSFQSHLQSVQQQQQ